MLPPQSNLTSFELRLLPVLTTPLSLAQIARVLGVPRAQVQVAAKSVYRKLGLSGPPAREAA